MKNRRRALSYPSTCDNERFDFQPVLFFVREAEQGDERLEACTGYENATAIGSYIDITNFQ